MFIDYKIIKIIKRTGGASDLDLAVLMQEYNSISMQTIGLSAMEYYADNDSMKYNTPEEVFEFLLTVPDRIEKDPVLRKKIQEDLIDVDMQILEKYKKFAPLGDRIYMQVYLKSKINALEKKIKESEENEKKENEDY